MQGLRRLQHMARERNLARGRAVHADMGERLNSIEAGAALDRAARARLADAMRASEGGVDTEVRIWPIEPDTQYIRWYRC